MLNYKGLHVLCSTRKHHAELTVSQCKLISVEFIYQVFTKTSPKRSFSVIQNERFGLVFAKTGSINSGTELTISKKHHWKPNKFAPVPVYIMHTELSNSQFLQWWPKNRWVHRWELTNFQCACSVHPRAHKYGNGRAGPLLQLYIHYTGLSNIKYLFIQVYLYMHVHFRNRHASKT
jgi:hypothetical protein